MVHTMEQSRSIPREFAMELCRMRETDRLLTLRAGCAGSSDAGTVADESRRRWMTRLRALPAVRQQRVDAIRAQIAAGTYDADGKIEAALERMIEEMLLEELARRTAWLRHV